MELGACGRDGREGRARRGRRGQDGAVVIMAAVCIIALFAFALLAIDGAMVMTTKTQLQNAADAAALAGASGLIDSQDEARSRAIDFAAYNRAVQDSLRPVVITAADVTFPASDRVRVVTHRTVGSGDALRTYFQRVVDLANPNTANVQAVAVARYHPVCSTDCVKPWAVADRWDDLNGDGKWQTGEPYDPIVTGYMPPADVGLRITLKWGDPHDSMEPGHFLPVCYPPLGRPEPPETGGNIYRYWIANCCPYEVGVGDSLKLEPGNMVGPTGQGVAALISQDPNAYWDDEHDAVAGSAFGISPRIIKVPFYDPTRPPNPGRDHVHVMKVGAFFLEEVRNKSVIGRFMRLGTEGEPCDPGETPGWLYGIALLQ